MPKLKKATERKTVTLQVRLSPKKAKDVRRRARMERVSTSAYLRGLINAHFLIAPK